MENRFSFKTEEGLRLGFSEEPDGSLTLVSCSRKPRGRMPDTLRLHGWVGERPIRRIAPLAFAPFHMEEERFCRLYHAPYSFNMFILMSGGKVMLEGKPLFKYLERSKTNIGIRVFRMMP